MPIHAGRGWVSSRFEPGELHMADSHPNVPPSSPASAPIAWICTSCGEPSVKTADWTSRGFRFRRSTAGDWACATRLDAMATNNARPARTRDVFMTG